MKKKQTLAMCSVQEREAGVKCQQLHIHVVDLVSIKAKV